MKTPPSPSSTASKSRLCAIFPGALGDFICCLPALQSLASEAQVDLFARSEFAAIAPERTTVYSLERPEIAKLFTPNGAADAQARRLFSDYTAVHSWLGSGQPEFVQQLRAVSNGTARIYPFHPADIERHQTEYYFQCIRGGEEPAPNPCISLRKDAVAWLDQFRFRHALAHWPVLVIGPGSGAREKNWPEKHFATVADWWRERLKGVVVVLIGAVEEERGVSPRLLNAGVIARDLDLAQAAALLTACAVYIGNDSGMTHLAAAVGVRTVALFGPTDPCRWAPRGARVTLLSRNETCAPCAVATMKQCPHRRCLTDLSADQVISTLAQLSEVTTLTRCEAGITV